MALKVSLFSVRPGAAHHAGLEPLVQNYLKRCGKALPASSKVFRTEAALLTAVADERKSGASNFYVADLGGITLDSLQFAEKFRAARDGGVRHLMLAIGPASGWSDAARASADMRLSLGGTYSAA